MKQTTNFQPAVNRQLWLPPKRLVKLDTSKKGLIASNLLYEFHYLSVCASNLFVGKFYLFIFRLSP